jgi:hypothetical protein
MDGLGVTLAELRQMEYLRWVGVVHWLSPTEKFPDSGAMVYTVDETFRVPLRFISAKQASCHTK